MMSLIALTWLVYLALGGASFATVLLVALLIIDYRRGKLW